MERAASRSVDAAPVAARVEAVDATYHACSMRRFGVSGNGRLAYALYRPGMSREIEARIVELANGRETANRIKLATSTGQVLLDVRRRQFGTTGVVLPGAKGSVVVYDLAERRVTRTYPNFRTDGFAVPNSVATYRDGWYVIPVYWGTSAFQRLNLETGAVDFVRQEWSKPVDWRLGPGGNIVTRTLRDKAGHRLFEVAERDGRWRTVVTYDGRRAIRAFVPDNYEAGRTGEFWVFNNLNGSTRWARLRLSDGHMTYPPVPAGKMLRYALTAANELAWATYRRDDGHLAHFIADESSRALWAAIAPNDQATVEIDEYSDDGAVVAATIEDENDRRRMAVFRRDGVTFREVFTFCSEPAGRVTMPTPVSVAAADGFRSYAYLYTPASPSRVDILYLHGGPKGASSQRYNPMFQYLIDEGHRVLSLDYRGSAGYGDAYIEAGWNAYDRGMVDDVLAAARVLRGARCRGAAACEARIVVVGDSLGAYLAQAAVMRAPDLFAGLVSISGLSDLSDPKMLRGRFTQPGDDELDRIFDLRSAGTAARLRRASPSLAMDRISVPALYIHAKDDRRVPLPQSQAMVDGLRARGRRAELVVFDKGGHDLECHQCRARLALAVGDFVLNVAAD